MPLHLTMLSDIKLTFLLELLQVAIRTKVRLCLSLLSDVKCTLLFELLQVPVRPKVPLCMTLLSYTKLTFCWTDTLIFAQYP